MIAKALSQIRPSSKMKIVVDQQSSRVVAPNYVRCSGMDLGKGIGFSRAVIAQAFLFCALAPEVSSSLWNQTAQCSRAGDRHRRTMDAQSRKRGQWRGCAHHLLHRGSKWGERRPLRQPLAKL